MTIMVMKIINTNIYKLVIVAIITFGLLLGLAGPVGAHPGNTASDGCHYCRTNCTKWGVAWNERHCHGITRKPTSTPKKQAPKKQQKKEKLR